MKEKTKKGFFGFFQNARSSAESSEKSVITAAASPEESKNEDLKEAASDSTEQKGSAAVTAPPETEQKAPSHSSIWEQSDDPLIVRIDEEALYSECAQFSSKMNSLSNVFKRTAENTQEPEPQPKAAQAHLYISHAFSHSINITYSTVSSFIISSSSTSFICSSGSVFSTGPGT